MSPRFTSKQCQNTFLPRHDAATIHWHTLSPRRIKLCFLKAFFQGYHVLLGGRQGLTWYASHHILPNYICDLISHGRGTPKGLLALAGDILGGNTGPRARIDSAVNELQDVTHRVAMTDI